jgi:hypothetical protein
MTESVITTEHNVVNPVSTDSSGNVVTDSSGNPAGYMIIALISGEDETNNLLRVEHQYTAEHVTADTQVKGAAGFLHSITFACTDAAPTAGSIIVYDSLTETGTILYSETFTTTAFRGYTVIIDGAFTTGLYVGFTTTADVGVTVSYR